MSLMPKWFGKLAQGFKPNETFNLDKFFEDFSELSQFGTHSGLNISSDDKFIYVSAHVPGLAAKEVDVSIDKDNVLWIKGEKKEEEGDKSKRIYKRSQTSFSYCVPLWDEIDFTIEPEANVKNGVMRLKFAKKKESQIEAKKIPVKDENE